MHTLINSLVRKFLYGFMLLGVVILLLGVNGLPVARAQESGGSGPGGPHRLPNGKWFMPKGAQGQMRVGAQNVTPLTSTGGPDDFGYTWNDTGTFSWIDTTSGTDTQMTGDSSGQAVGAVALPFSFKYYENTYTSLYIAASGYLSFTNNGYWDDQGQIPSPSSPNNVIAPYWSPFNIGTGSWVHYYSGGSAPNRYFVVEWHDVAGGYGIGGNYRFEVILRENGNIVFQYHTMNIGSNGYYCGSAGIEDSTGEDGLTYLAYCDTPPSSSTTVTFYRPAPSARVRIWPSNQGLFTSPGALESYQVSIYNTGELGADTYDLTLSSTWTASLYAGDGVTLLTDTNHDGIVDTGSVPQGSQVTIIIKMQTPGGAVVGNANTATLTARSSVDISKSRTATLHTAVPAPYGQIYRDDANEAMSLYLVQPGAQAVKKVTADNYYGYDMAVTETPSAKFVYAWDKSRCLDSSCNTGVGEIEYTLLDHYGNTVRPVSKLTDNSGATMGTYDYSPSVAVAPDGRIGVVWYRYLYNSTSQFNYNIYFSTLDGSGNLLSGPTNITNNAVWGTDSDLNIPELYSPTIAATDDNRFILSWNDERQVNVSSRSENIWHATRDTAGASVSAPAALTSDNNSWSPILNSLTGGKAILTWNNGCAPIYAVLNSNGTVSKAATSLGVSGGCGNSDAVLLPSGKVTVAWGTDTGVQFDILDASYNLVVGPITLPNPAAMSGNDYVSVTADSVSHAILTWMDANSQGGLQQNLYYALVDGTGSVLTSPMIYRHGQGSSPYIETSYNGQGNVPNQIVHISGNAGVAGVILNYSGGSTVADGSGNYIIPVTGSWSGTVMPSKMCYNFSPNNRSYTNIWTDQTGQDYTATAFTTCWMIYLPLVIR